MLKDLAVNLSLNPLRRAAVDYSISIATTFEAHLTGIAFMYDPTLPSVYAGTPMPGSDIVFNREEAKRRADVAIKGFEETARRTGLNVESQAIETPATRAADTFAKIARRFDLIIVGQTEPAKETIEDRIAEAALFASARPILFVPYIHKSDLSLRHVTVCWDGSRAATRAINDAIPFLKKANRIDIVVMENGRSKSEDLPGIGMAQHLTRHGIKVELKRIQLSLDVGNTILNYASDMGTDLIVMGGYGHSRVREFILGGATRTLLEKMTVPTLMSH